MGRPGLPELLLILLVVLLLFGSKRLPDLSRSVGRSLRILKSETKAMRDDDADDDDRGSAAVDEPRREITGGGAAPRPVAAPTSEEPSDARAREGSESR